MLKRIGLATLIILIVVVMATFTANNPGMIDIDLAFTKFATSIPLAFAVTFAVGWLFGVLCIGMGSTQSSTHIVGCLPWSISSLE